MQKHMHLARVPQGQERDYIRGLLHFMYNDGRKMKMLMYFVSWGIAAILWGASFRGVYRVINEGLNAGLLILLFVFSALLTLMLVKAARVFSSKKELADFNNIQVWDVQVVDVIRTRGNATVYYAKAMFADGTVSSSQFKLELYSLHSYQYGLVVLVYNDQGVRVQQKLIPRMDISTKAYKLSKRGL